MNGEYAKKAISCKWPPNLKLLVIEKIEVRVRVRVTDSKLDLPTMAMSWLVKWFVLTMSLRTEKAKEKTPFLMKPTVKSELHE
jgi:hypothetical protein